MEREKPGLLGLVVETAPDKAVIVYRLVKVMAVGQQAGVTRSLPPLTRWQPILARVVESVRGLPNINLVIPSIGLPGIKIIAASAVDSQFHEGVKESFRANGLPIEKILFEEPRPNNWSERGTGDLLTEIEKAGCLPF